MAALSITQSSKQMCMCVRVHVRVGVGVGVGAAAAAAVAAGAGAGAGVGVCVCVCVRACVRVRCSSCYGKSGTYSIGDSGSQMGPFGVVTSASGARTNAVFKVIRSAKKSNILGTDHISASSTTMLGMNTCESRQTSWLCTSE